MISARGGQRDLRKVVCFGDADLRVRSDQLLLRLEDVRAALEQTTTEVPQELPVDVAGRRASFLERRSRGFFPTRMLMKFSCCSIRCSRSGSRRRGEDELFSLSHIEHGRGAAVGKDLSQSQRVLSRGERLARDLQFEVLFAQLKIGARNIADQRADDLTLRPLLREQVGPGGLGRAPEFAPKIQLPRERETDLVRARLDLGSGRSGECVRSRQLAPALTSGNWSAREMPSSARASRIRAAAIRTS